jgi:hypothetical protein
MPERYLKLIARAVGFKFKLMEHESTTVTGNEIDVHFKYSKMMFIAYLDEANGMVRLQPKNAGNWDTVAID